MSPLAARHWSLRRLSGKPFRSGVTVAVLVAAGCGLIACEEHEPPPHAGPRSAPPPIKPPTAVYTVRGTVDQIPIDGEPQTEFRVHHEAIDNFKNQSGLVVGMSAMTMPFPLGPGVRLDGVGVGDHVELTFAIWWDQEAPEYHITRLRKLPAETKLEFREARPDLSTEKIEPAPASTTGLPVPRTP